MWTRELTARQKTGTLLSVLILLVVVVGVGLLLREHGPGNMGTGFLQGAAVGLVAFAVVLWRVSRAPDKASSFERAFTSSGDERDDDLLTRALAVLGLAAFPLTGAAAVAIGLGAEVAMVMFFLLIAQLAVGVVAYVVIARRS
ncbi:hypothetical protein [Ornithinimicrobium pratense]|uniref:DUF2178 domain-containing protein n=1 Tax=Ornithinimicrobium pratense TaxID=2593973 RepID=A0A5J6V1L0_9MICO|nr:hypothetical protein [Ornithinimicrobium pratense]QFG67478.1 hypothetical protein FY030_00950 [Ornithinimicrobium pratense]